MTEEQQRLKLVVLYDANRNEYSILKHNEPAESAKAFVDEWNPHLVSGASMIVLDQTKVHRVTDPQQCRTCREIVARTANLSPKPKFVRRKES